MAEVVRVVQYPTQTVRIPQAVGPRGQAGVDGASAYELAVVHGFVGTEAEWLESLVGAPGTNGVDGTDGTNGTDGADGTNGTNGTNGVDGEDGADGLSAYQLALAGGFVGTQAEWLTSLHGADGTDGTDGTDGADGVGVPVGGTTGQILAKASPADHDTGWIDPPEGGGAAPARQTTTLTAATGTGTITLAPTARILAIETSAAARVRLYRSDAQRTDDAARAFTTTPSGDAVLADHDFTAAGEQWTNPVYTLARDGASFYYSVTGTADVTFTWQEVGA